MLSRDQDYGTLPIIWHDNQLWKYIEEMPTRVVRTRIANGGRVVIPAAYRRALGLRVGDEVVLQLHDDEVRLLTLDQVIAHAQQIVGRQVPAGRSLVNELIAERRLEAQRE